MAIDFEEEDVQKTALATCAQHNLKYNPNVTWGCVLCRTNQKKRISWYLVVGGILISVAISYYLFPIIYSNEKPNSSSVVSVGNMSTDDLDDASSEAFSCRIELSKKIEDCIAKVDSASANARMDREFCLNVLSSVDDTCKQELVAQNYLEEPLYNVRSLPSWPAIRRPIEANQEKIEQCVGCESYSFSVRVSVDGDVGKVSDMTLSLFGLNISQRFCLYQFFKSLDFPKKSKQSYVFVTKIESTELAMNKPQKVDNREAEFKKFLESQRKAKLDEERRAKIMAKRGEFDRQFKKEMTSNK